jgi:cyclopropane fatty-acyl-phospholipid synthase-like methyltransferase
MDKALQQYYEERFNMMATQGWQDLLEDAEKMIETYDNVSAIETIENLHFKKGQLDILRWLVSLKQTSEEVFKELEDEKNV